MSPNPFESRIDSPESSAKRRISDDRLDVRAATGEAIPPECLAELERLDDVIFSALDGNADALDESARLYRRTSRQAPRKWIEESREQYIRHAEAIVEDYQRSPGESLGKTFAALEILMLVADD